MPNYSAKDAKAQEKNDRDPYALSVLTHRRNTLTATYAQDAQGQVTKSKAPAFSTFFDHSAVRAADIYAFAEVLADLATRPHSCIIRGAVKPDLGADSNSILWDGRVRKVCHDKPTSYKAAFGEVDRIFALGDSDGVTLPFAVDPKDPQDLDRAAQYILEKHGLTGVSCVVQWSSSAFLTDTAEIAPHKAKAHIWFAFDKPVASEALKPWLLAKQLDPTLAQCVQLHYTANPVFVGDLRDPLAWRVKVFQGAQDALDADSLGLYDNAEAQRRKEAKESQAAKQRAKQAAEDGAFDALVLGARDRFLRRNALATSLRIIRNAEDGGINAAFFRAAFRLGRDGGDNKEAFDALLSAALAKGTDAAKDEATITRGFAAGVQRHERRGKVKKVKADLIRLYANKPQQPNQQAPTRYLPSLPQMNAVLCVKASLGVGKTEQAALLAAQYPSCLWVAPRVALTRNAEERLRDQGFVHYQDLDGAIKTPKTILCVDSIDRVGIAPRLVVLDEADQDLQSLVKSARDGDTDAILTKVSRLKTILENADQVLLLSADLDTHTAEAFALLAQKPIANIAHTWEHPDQSWTIFDQSATWKERVKSAWMDKERLAIFAASRGEAKRLAEWLKQLRPETTVLAVHGEAEDAARDSLADVNERWKVDAVIFTSSAGTGVSFDVPGWFDRVCVWGMSAPSTLPASEYLQGAARVRSPKQRDVWAWFDGRDRVKRSKEEIAAHLEAKEAKTLETLRSIGGFGVNEQREILRSKNEPIVASVLLSALAQREERTASPLGWVLQRLYERGINIVLDETKTSKAKAKTTRQEIGQAAEAVAVRRVVQLVEAVDLTPAEAKTLRNKELRRQEQAALEQHEIAAFYHATTEDEAPPRASEALIERDRKGQTRKEIRRLVDALAFRFSPEYFGALDTGDTVEDRGERDALKRRRVRSAADARHHYQNAKMLSDLLHLVEAAHCQEGWNTPDKSAVLWEGGTHLASNNTLFSLFGGCVPPLHQAVESLLADPFTVEGLRLRGLDLGGDLNRLIGSAANLFGLKRTSTNKRTEDGGRRREYALDLTHLQCLFDLGQAEAGRTAQKIFAWKTEQACIASLEHTAEVEHTPNTQAEVEHPPNTQAEVEHTPNTQAEVEHTPSILNAFAGEALAWCGLDDSATFEAKATALLRLEGAECVAELALHAGRMGQDTHAILTRLDAICAKVAEYLGADISALIPYTHRLFMA